MSNSKIAAIVASVLFATSDARTGLGMEIINYDSSVLPQTTFLGVHASPTPGLPAGISYGQFTWHGPVLDTHRPLSGSIGEVVSNGDQSRFFGMGGHDMYEVLQPTGTRRLEPSGVPEISWSMGMTYDVARDRLITATLGGEGFLYSFRPQTDEWSVISSLNHLDLTAIAYYPPNDHLYGLSRGDGLLLHKFDSDGNQVDVQSLSIPLLASFIDRSVQLIAVDDYLALIQYPDSRGRGVPNGLEQGRPAIYAIKPTSGQQFLVVPEPASLALCGVASAGLAWVRRRRP